MLMSSSTMHGGLELCYFFGESCSVTTELFLHMHKNTYNAWGCYQHYSMAESFCLKKGLVHTNLNLIVKFRDALNLLCAWEQISKGS